MSDKEKDCIAQLVKLFKEEKDPLTFLAMWNEIGRGNTTNQSAVVVIHEQIWNEFLSAIASAEYKEQLKKRNKARELAHWYDSLVKARQCRDKKW